jgi:hypothetical protein
MCRYPLPLKMRGEKGNLSPQGVDALLCAWRVPLAWDGVGVSGASWQRCGAARLRGMPGTCLPAPCLCVT